jgi:hypothetical protein
MSETEGKRTFTQKAKSLSVFVPTAAVLVLSAALATPWLSTIPAAYANGDNGDNGDGKVTICHIPPGNPENAHTISVGASAVAAHLAHGDTLGPCEKQR